MSYTQDHHVPNLADLYQTLTGEQLNMEQIFKDKLREKGFVIESEKEVMLYDGDICCDDVYGKEVIVREIDNRGFETGRKIYVPKLIRKVTANGNYGLDVYEWKEKDDTNFKVEQESHGEIGSED